MAGKVYFNNNEFEVALMTYNRPEFVKKWMQHSVDELLMRGITIVVYDASPNNKTKAIIEEYRNRYDSLGYVSVDPKTTPGYMTMEALMHTNAEYVWVAGDSRIHDFEELDKELFCLIHQKPDYCVIDIYGVKSGVYSNKISLIKNTIISTTCTGLSVYKCDVFSRLRKDKRYKDAVDRKFQNNYAFAFMGYLYDSIEAENIKAYICPVGVRAVSAGKKKQNWQKHFYRCWVDDLCKLIDHIDLPVEMRDIVLKETWLKMRLSSHEYTYIAKKSGDLTRESYNNYINNGELVRVTDDAKKIMFYAYAPMIVVEIINILYIFPRIIRKLKAIAKKGIGKH